MTNPTPPPSRALGEAVGSAVELERVVKHSSGMDVAVDMDRVTPIALAQDDAGQVDFHHGLIGSPGSTCRGQRCFGGGKFFGGHG